VLELLLAELSSQHASSLFAPILRARCCAAVRTALHATTAPRRDESRQPLLARAVPERLRAAVQHWRANHTTLEPLVLAFRAFVATRMHALLRLDAATPPAELQPVVNVARGG